ncbi:MAG: hypothetical protein ACYCQJ_04010 [Nitrososphaerales archaeon]
MSRPNNFRLEDGKVLATCNSCGTEKAISLAEINKNDNDILQNYSIVKVVDYSDASDIATIGIDCKYCGSKYGSEEIIPASFADEEDIRIERCLGCNRVVSREGRGQ